MSRSTQSHTVEDRGTATPGARRMAHVSSPMHPHDTNYLPHPGRLGESDGPPVDPDASYDNGVTGPVAVELTTPHVEKQIDGPLDVDWFSVELVAGRTYVFHIRAAATQDDTLEDPAFGGFWFDPDGDGRELQELAGHEQTDGGHGANTVLAFTPTQSGTCYFAAIAPICALQSATGSYSVEVHDCTDDALGVTPDVSAYDFPIIDTGAPGDLIGTASPGARVGDERANSSFGRKGGDHLRGRIRDDVIRGGDGDDILVGGNGEDRLRGGDGDDARCGGIDVDFLVGGLGTGVLTGGQGNDNVRGEHEADGFAFISCVANNGTVRQFGDDAIHDFNPDASIRTKEIRSIAAQSSSATPTGPSS